MSLNILQLSIIHRLPQSYRWLAGSAGLQVEPVAQNETCLDTCLTGLKLLGHEGEKARAIMDKLSQALSDIEIPCSVIECEGELCLFVSQQDEFAATCRLKNCGVAIAESIATHHTPA